MTLLYDLHRWSEFFRVIITFKHERMTVNDYRTIYTIGKSVGWSLSVKVFISFKRALITLTFYTLFEL